MSGPPTREALVIVFDISKSDDFELGRTVCSQLIQQKFVYSPRDQVGLIYGGTDGTLNRLNTAAPKNYKHLTVKRPVMAADAEFLKVIDEVKHPEGGNFDMLDGLILAQDLMQESVGERRFNRRIVLVTSAKGHVKRKDDLAAIIDALKNKGISLVVIGLQFADEIEEEDWTKMTLKEQNEKVLGFMCQQLSGDSLVIPVSDAASALGALRKRNIPQRAYTRMVLDVGQIRLPVCLYVKTLIQVMPSMGRVTKSGEDIIADRRFYSTRDPTVEMDPTNRVKAFRYGRSVIPFNEVDEAALKLDTKKSISVLGFINQDAVPLHLLQGGSKAIAPLPNDPNGAKCFSAFVHGMEHLQKAMLVRFCFRDKSDPTLGVCYPSAKTERDILYFAQLPFAEDLRHYTFPSLNDVHVSKAEADAVDQLVDAMSLEALDANEDTSDTLKPKTTYNPALQLYYAAIQERYLRPDAPLATLPKALAETSCHWGEPGNCLHEHLARSKNQRKRVRDLFPPPATDDGGKKLAKKFWYMDLPTDAETAEPPTHKGHKKDTYFGSDTSATTPATEDATPGGSDVSSSLKDGMTIAVGMGKYTSPAAPAHVTTVDPAQSFLALLARKGEDNVHRAIHEMTEVIFRLLKSSIGEQNYKRCGTAVAVLRKACVKEAEPILFNKFLSNLLHVTRGAVHNKFWMEYVQKADVGPITSKECEDSDVTEEDARNFFSSDKDVARPLDLGDDEEESMFDALE